MALNNYKPELPNKYKESQIILSSGRLLFNAKEDSVLIFSKKSIGLSSNGTINIDSDSYFILNSSKIYLGLKAHNEKQPLILGKNTNDWLTDLTNALTKFVSLVKAGGGSPQSIMAATGVIEPVLINLNMKLKHKELLSKTNFTV